MTLKKEQEKQKQMQEKHQTILANLLREEDNKYCVDCDAKGPRWASWNLGIFLCIRCAGIHRNLGCHISKVKSVNLDSWNEEQVAMMTEMGNSRARAVYEANIPDGYRRPQSDSALEQFIRSKYEHKKYIAQEWVPPKPKLSMPNDILNRPKGSSTHMTAAISKLPSSSTVTKASSTGAGAAATISNSNSSHSNKNSAETVDLLGLDLMPDNSTVASLIDCDEFSMMAPHPMQTVGWANYHGVSQSSYPSSSPCGLQYTLSNEKQSTSSSFSSLQFKQRASKKPSPPPMISSPVCNSRNRLSLKRYDTLGCASDKTMTPGKRDEPSVTPSKGFDPLGGISPANNEPATSSVPAQQPDMTASAAAAGATTQQSFTTNTSTTSNSESLFQEFSQAQTEQNTKSSKDKILSLYGNQPSQQPVYGIPGGVYMGAAPPTQPAQQQQQQQQGFMNGPTALPVNRMQHANAMMGGPGGGMPPTTTMQSNMMGGGGGGLPGGCGIPQSAMFTNQVPMQQHVQQHNMPAVAQPGLMGGGGNLMHRHHMHPQNHHHPQQHQHQMSSMSGGFSALIPNNPAPMFNPMQRQQQQHHHQQQQQQQQQQFAQVQQQMANLRFNQTQHQQPQQHPPQPQMMPHVSAATFGTGGGGMHALAGGWGMPASAAAASSTGSVGPTLRAAGNAAASAASGQTLSTNLWQ